MITEGSLKGFENPESKVYNFDDVEAYGCPNCNFDKMFEKNVIKTDVLFSYVCFNCGHEFLVLKCDEDIISLPIQHPYQGIDKKQYVKKSEGELYLPRENTNYVLFESYQSAEKIRKMICNVFKDSKNTAILRDKYCVTEYTIKRDENCLKFEFKYSRFKTLDFVNCLAIVVKENGNIINEEMIIKALNLELSLLDLWELECEKRLKEIFSFEKIKETLLEFEKTGFVSNFKTSKITNLQNHFLYFGTIFRVSNCIEGYNSTKYDFFKIRYKRQIIGALKQLYEYLSNENFDFGEDVSNYFGEVEKRNAKPILAKVLYDEEKNKVEFVKRLIKKMLESKFE